MFPLNSEMAYIKEDGTRSKLGDMLDKESSDISDLKNRMETAEGDIDTLEGKMTTAEGDISDLSDAISDAFDNTKTYAVGDYFIYEDKIYEVITACTGITPPNAEYYTAHNVTDLITTLNSSLNDYISTPTRLLYQLNPAYGTSYSFSGSSDYRFLLLYIDSSGWRNTILLPTAIFAGAYMFDAGGYSASLRADTSPSSVSLSKLNSSLGVISSISVYGIK